MSLEPQDKVEEVIVEEEGMETASVEEQTSLLEEPKHNWKKLFAMALTMVVAVACFSFFYYVMQQVMYGSSEDQVIAELLDENHHAKLDEYKSYLKVCEGDEDLIEVYVDDVENGQLITVHNTSKVFFSGDLELIADGKTVDTLKVKMAEPYSYTQFYESYEVEPNQYRFENTHYLQFDYPDVDFDYPVSHDYDDEGIEWLNVELGDQCSVENMITIAKRSYGMSVLGGAKYNSLYFYDETVQFFENEGYEFYDLDTVKYIADLDTENEEIVLYEWVDNQWKEIENISMNEGGVKR